MAIKIILENNYGYKWFEHEGISVRGYMQRNGEVFTESSFVEELNTINTFAEFTAFLREIDGCFSIVIKKNGKVFGATDLSRSMPLYYAKDGSCISDSLDAISKYHNLSVDDIDPTVLEELITSAFISHSRTVFRSTAQIDLGQAIEVSDGEIKSEYYYTHFSEIKDLTRPEAMELFQRTTDAVFDEIIRVANGRPLVISLSGGYDSRYIACMLKKKGVKEVSCYSYGTADSHEIDAARQVAENLGFRWAFVEYSDTLIKECFGSGDIDYFSMYTGIDSDAYTQNYPAVKKLHDEGWFKPNSVFITGLCNDLPTGYYVSSTEAPSDFEPSIDYLVKRVINDRNFYKKISPRAREAYELELRKTIREKELCVNNYQDFISAYEAIDTGLDHSRRFLHMNKVHEFFGYQWLLPCWNKSLLNFWYSMPLKYREKQNLYEEWITTQIPYEYGVGAKKKVVSYTLYKGFARFKARIKLLLNRLVFVPLGISMKDKTDFNNFNMVNSIYFKKIKQRNLIKFRNLHINIILVLYMLEHRFGNDFYKLVINRQA